MNSRQMNLNIIHVVRSLWIILFILPLIPMNGLYRVLPFGTELFNIGPYLSLVYCILLIIKTKGRCISKPTKWYIAFCFIAFLSSWWNSSTFSSYEFFCLIRILSFLLLTDYFLKRFTSDFLIVLCIGLVLIVFMNINDVFQDFTLLSGVDLFYKGNKEYFIASDNFMGYYLVPIMTIIACTFLVKKQKITIMGWTLLGITVINIMMVWSGTGVFGCCLFMLLLSFSVCKRKSTERKEIINCKNLIILYIALYLLIVVFQAGNLFSFITEGLLHKSANFTGRTNLWSEALRQIFDSPISLIIGHGGASGGRFIIAGLSSGNAPHNLLLDVACQFGIMGVFCYLKMFYVAIKKLKTYEETLIGKTITFALFSQFIMYLTEGTYLLNTLQYILITLTWNIDVLLKTEKS